MYIKRGPTTNCKETTIQPTIKKRFKYSNLCSEMIVHRLRTDKHQGIMDSASEIIVHRLRTDKRQGNMERVSEMIEHDKRTSGNALFSHSCKRVNSYTAFLVVSL